ncbi:MAG TPA: transcription elongation factor GreA [Acidiferrobacteraceae bacterium]|nr:transcription elongation factor GreA [Acidiferrobacteraceae bacterium]HEX20195.1 transcription elongation factor GreA [Acidiferrobacteraceae bacterium]
MSKIPLTVKGAEELQKELRELKAVVRPRIIQAISEARAHGDLSENAEYHAAKEQQSFNEGRIAELDSSLAVAELIDPTTLDVGSRVVFGATVELYDEENDKKVSYQIVGELEADIKQSRLSINTPIARALIGKEEGDEVEVQVPDGVRRYEILSVKYI